MNISSLIIKVFSLSSILRKKWEEAMKQSVHHAIEELKNIWEKCYLSREEYKDFFTGFRSRSPNILIWFFKNTISSLFT